jgi:hypothetical protein
VLYYVRFPRDLQFRVIHICVIQYDYGSAKEACENFARPIENNTCSRVDFVKRLRLPASTLNSIFAKKNDIRQQIQKCGNACKKRKTGKESTFAELETVLFTWYQHSVTDVDHENILSLEKSYFQLR